MTQDNKILSIAGDMADIRHDLHRHPQLAYEETYANGVIKRQLSGWGIAFEDGIAKTGIVATIPGRTNKSGRRIGLRCDIDALPILEENGQPWSSTMPGRMHACGHDGHTSIMLGVAWQLSQKPDFDGTVHLIFQPAEEGGSGAARMIAEGLFDRFPMQRVFAIHNWPYMPRGRVGVLTGPIMACSDYANITVHGRGGHAGIPHEAIDPVVIGAQIVTNLQSIVARTVSPLDQAVVTVSGFQSAPGPRNAIPATVELTLSVRSLSPAVRDSLEKKIGEIAANIAQAHGGRIDYRYTRMYDATINTAAEADLCAAAAADVFGPQAVDRNMLPSMAAEDFGAMLEKAPGCYVWIGQAETDQLDSPHNKGLHHPGYDFNDKIIAPSIAYFTRLVALALPGV